MRKSRELWPFILVWPLLVLRFTASLGAVPDGTSEVTSLVKIKPASVRVNSTDQTLYGKLRLTNRSNKLIHGPLGVVIAALSPNDASLLNSNGTLPDGTSYVELIPEDESLSPGKSTAFFSLAFHNPRHKPVKYQTIPYGVLPAVATTPAAGQIDITGMVKISLPRPKFDRRTKTYRTYLRLTNMSIRAITAPVSLALPGFLPDVTELHDATGQLEDGSAYIDIPVDNGRLPPKNKTAPLLLRFDNPSRTKIRLEPTVYGILASTSGSDPVFDASNVWDQRIDGAMVHPSSAQMITQLTHSGGWGTGLMRIDFSISVLNATLSTPLLDFVPNTNFYIPDCDQVPFPVPEGGAVEGETGYECSGGGDCHLLVVDKARGKLYEMYSASIVGNAFSGGCAVVWDLHRSYAADLRGEQCTSSDAAGLPIAALLFSADEIAAGSIDHAIRFILPNSKIRAGVYVHPATHAGDPSGGALALPYGSRLRLRADFPLASLPGDGARIIATAMQRYGIILADGGNIALTARNDRFTQHKWDEVGVDTRSLSTLQVNDFEVIDTGPVVDLTYDCVRNGH